MEEQITTTESEVKDVQPGAETAPPAAEEPSAENLNAFQKFLSGLFGGKEGKAADPEPGKAEEKASDGKKEEDPAGSGEKTFTQADLEAAVEAAHQKWLDEAAEAERVKKLTPEQKAAEEQQKKDEEIASLRSQLLQKELKETAVRSLEAEGFPAGLAGMLDYSSRERMEETLKSATEIFKESLASAVQSRLKGKTPEGLGNAVSADSLLRAQIEKNIMG